jgi:hypothetical protein
MRGATAGQAGSGTFSFLLADGAITLVVCSVNYRFDRGAINDFSWPILALI